MDNQTRQQELTDKGDLQIRVNQSRNGKPIENALVKISYTGNPTSELEEVKTDESGNTERIELDAPPLEYSMEPSEQQPYSEYTIEISAPGFTSINISGIEVFSGQTAIQNVELDAQDTVENQIENIVIPANTLFGNYPPKIPEEEVKTVNESGEIVLSRVVIPEYIVVHDGAPTDSTAMNYYVKYRDYIKNVASSEIYSTWPDATIRANVLAIMSFTLNRVYTEW